MQTVNPPPLVTSTNDNLVRLRCTACEVASTALKEFSTPAQELATLPADARHLTMHIEQTMQAACLLLTKSIEIIERTHALRSTMKAS